MGFTCYDRTPPRLFGSIGPVGADDESDDRAVHGITVPTRVNAPESQSDNRGGRDSIQRASTVSSSYLRRAVAGRRMRLDQSPLRSPEDAE